jgi:hypothetical protein
LLLILTAAVAVGCSSDEPDERSSESPSTVPAGARSFVGTAEGTSAFVGLVVDGSRVLAYVCDGEPADPVGAPPTVQIWFNGPSDGRSIDVQQAAGQLQAQLTDAGMAGTVTLPDGRTIAVTGQPVTGDAGLYRAEASGDGTSAVAGWILAADGAQRGGVGTESGGVSKASGVRPLNTAQLSFSFQGLATARIAKVGITPIPIP